MGEEYVGIKSILQYFYYQKLSEAYSKTGLRKNGIETDIFETSKLDYESLAYDR